MTTRPDPPTAARGAPVVPETTEPPPIRRPFAGLLVPAAVGVALVVALGVYGRVHVPTGFAVNLAGFSRTGYVKAWLATVAAVLAVGQLLSALVMYGRLGVAAPRWIATAHRWSGRLAVLVTVPVAVHCLFAFGLRFDEPRVLVHSIVGCLFYGAFVTKMLLLTRRGLPGWALPVLGALVFTGLVVLWLTASLWLFTTKGLKF